MQGLPASSASDSWKGATLAQLEGLLSQVSGRWMQPEEAVTLGATQLGQAPTPGASPSGSPASDATAAHAANTSPGASRPEASRTENLRRIGLERRPSFRRRRSHACGARSPEPNTLGRRGHDSGDRSPVPVPSGSGHRPSHHKRPITHKIGNDSRWKSPQNAYIPGPGAYKVDRDHPEHPDHDRPVGMLRWALGSDAAIPRESRVAPDGAMKGISLGRPQDAAVVGQYAVPRLGVTSNQMLGCMMPR
eukprot:g31174.t1